MSWSLFLAHQTRSDRVSYCDRSMSVVCACVSVSTAFSPKPLGRFTLKLECSLGEPHQELFKFFAELWLPSKIFKNLLLQNHKGLEPLYLVCGII